MRVDTVAAPSGAFDQDAAGDEGIDRPECGAFVKVEALLDVGDVHDWLTDE
jgi:hypothetical protein